MEKTHLVNLAMSLAFIKTIKDLGVTEYNKALQLFAEHVKEELQNVNNEILADSITNFK